MFRRALNNVMGIERDEVKSKNELLSTTQWNDILVNRLSPKQHDRAVQILCRENPAHLEHCEQLTVRYRLPKSCAQTY